MVCFLLNYQVNLCKYFTAVAYKYILSILFILFIIYSNYCYNFYNFELDLFCYFFNKISHNQAFIRNLLNFYTLNRRTNATIIY